MTREIFYNASWITDTYDKKLYQVLQKNLRIAPIKKFLEF